MNNPKSPTNAPAKKDSPLEHEEYSSLEDELRKRLSSLLPKQGQEEVIRQIVSVTYREAFSGPIAHPRHLREYEAINPGAADRIIAMAEKQQAHQIAMDNKVVDNEYNDRRIGMWLGASTFALLIIGAVVCAITGHAAVALALVSAAAIGGVGLFVNGRKNGQNE